MDPVATLAAFDLAVSTQDVEAIEEHADALVAWLEKGGFKPCGPHGADWRGKLTDGQLASYFRMASEIARMKVEVSTCDVCGSKVPLSDEDYEDLRRHNALERN